MSSEQHSDGHHALPRGGESQVGVVQRVDDKIPHGQHSEQFQDDNSPVVERSFRQTPEPAAPVAPTAPATAPDFPTEVVLDQPPPAPVALQPVLASVRASVGLQESSVVPIPERMNQLQSKNKSLRSDLEALELALKKPMP